MGEHKLSVEEFNYLEELPFFASLPDETKGIFHHNRAKAENSLGNFKAAFADIKKAIGYSTNPAHAQLMEEIRSQLPHDNE